MFSEKGPPHCFVADATSILTSECRTSENQGGFLVLAEYSSPLISRMDCQEEPAGCTLNMPFPGCQDSSPYTAP